MDSTTVFLLTHLLSSLMVATGKSPQSFNTSFYRNPSQLESTAKNVSSRRLCSEVAAWELGNFSESDIMVSNKTGLRHSLKTSDVKWPDGVVPVRMKANHFSQEDVKEIERAFRDFNKLSCVRIRRAIKDDEDYVLLTSEFTGCHSMLGRTGGEQVINLQRPACLLRGNIHHELMHTLGFIHEHNSPQRDKYIRIIWKNIRTDHLINFRKWPSDLINDFGVGYDYDSIMHYSKKAWSMNGKITIQPLDPLVLIGQRIKLSKKDIVKLKKFYDCK